MFKFGSIFLLLLVSLFTIELLHPVQTHLITPFTSLIADISATLIRMFDDNVTSYGKIIQSTQTGFAVSIEPGCNGVEAIIVLSSAVIAFPAQIKHKLYAITAGFIAIQTFNLIRIISLFYIGQWDLSIFEWAHLYVWPVVIMLDVLIIFLIWLRLLPAPGKTQETPA